MPSKYDALRDYLNEQSGPTVTLTFRQIEKLLGFVLPESARRHTAWWANAKGSHTYSKAWTSGGWKARPLLTRESVQFVAARRVAAGPSKHRGSEGDIKVAAEVWVATALLHREHPRNGDFGIGEIVTRAAKENLAGRLRPGVYQHVASHAVANRPPSPNKYCYLFATASNRRRLYRSGDPADPHRLRAKAVPAQDDLPAQYWPLLEWYRKVYGAPGKAEEDPILALVGLGKEIWKGVDPDEYVRKLREDWD